MLKDHPELSNIQLTGYPSHMTEINYRGEDELGNEYYAGDHVYMYDDEIYLKDELSQDAIEILEKHGAIETVAQ